MWLLLWIAKRWLLSLLLLPELSLPCPSLSALAGCSGFDRTPAAILPHARRGAAVLLTQLGLLAKLWGEINPNWSFSHDYRES